MVKLKFARRVRTLARERSGHYSEHINIVVQIINLKEIDRSAAGLSYLLIHTASIHKEGGFVYTKSGRAI